MDLRPKLEEDEIKILKLIAAEAIRERQLSTDMSWACVDTRKELFAIVDRMVKARVEEVIGPIVRDCKGLLHHDPHKLACQLNETCTLVERRIRQLRASFDSKVGYLVDESLRSISDHQVAEIAKRTKLAMGRTVATEVARQLAKFLSPPITSARRKGKAS